ncbi:DUF2798 domain-containing protein [Xinfangfangia sp. CPCC 101601]|uniref:DUF2798 domain-containing protein n=1 Tax=Pseudogemmobacter lacusdianii TaxID=3069608 RepID=A0ABU0VYJ7_9RHOB|nr:DUF2798 domain-containing protein [Xinfangfangia sp. CPCC 101601]MDQ2066265.1 DUF2798 domain-containing protein [Xinfangfangia sp. CPCC 101601]
MTKKTLIIAQLTITFCMAVTMSAVMSLIFGGYSDDFFSRWPLQALTAWPIAFIFTQAYGPLGFFVAHKLTARKG